MPAFSRFREVKNVPAPVLDIKIDMSELQEEIDFLKRTMKPEVFNQAMYGIFQRTSRHVSAILKKDLPPKYYVKGSEIAAVVKNPQLSISGSGVGCIIPLKDKQKNIGTGFSATGYRRGWNSLKGKYKINASIVKSGKSELPGKMDNQGGMPPFRNMPSKLGKLTFTRKGKARLPIVKVSGIAIPQMPMIRSRPEVEQDLDAYLKERIDARFNALIANGR